MPETLDVLTYAKKFDMNLDIVLVINSLNHMKMSRLCTYDTYGMHHIQRLIFLWK